MRTRSTVDIGSSPGYLVLGGWAHLIWCQPKPESFWDLEFVGIGWLGLGVRFFLQFSLCRFIRTHPFESVKNVISFFACIVYCIVILLMLNLSCKIYPGNPLHCHQIRNSWLISPFIFHILPNVASFSRNRKIMSLRIYYCAN